MSLISKTVSSLLLSLTLLIFSYSAYATNTIVELRAKHSNKCLDVSGNSQHWGAQLIQWGCHGRDNQRFRLNVVEGSLQGPQGERGEQGLSGLQGEQGLAGVDSDSFFTQDGNNDVFLDQNNLTISNGKLASSGNIKVGNSQDSCTTTNEGELRYNSTIKNMQFCNGSSWQAFSISATETISYDDPLADNYFDDGFDNPYKLGSAFSSGDFYNCAIKLDSTVVCWGSNYFGAHIPTSTLVNIKQLATGYANACALKLDNTVECWGSNRYGGTNVPSGLIAKQIASANETNCALKLDNTVTCWGSNYWGNADIPAELTAKQITMGTHTCALKLDNTVICWGTNGTINIPEGLTAKQITAGNGYACALKLDNTVGCWGNSVLNVPSELIAKQIAGGYDHACALKLDNTVECWGSSNALNVPSGLIAKQITSGTWHTCALKLDNTVECWGNSALNVPSGLIAKQF